MRIVIAGAGEMGVHLARLLAQEKQDIIVIDLNKEQLQYVENHLDVITLKGDATSPKILEEANVSKAALFIAVTSTEANNIVSCIYAKKMGAKQTICRISNSEYIDKNTSVNLHDLGIDSMISPEILAADEICRLVDRNAFTDTFEFDGGQLQLVGIHLEKHSPLLNEQNSQLKNGVYYKPVAIKRKSTTIIPSKETYFEEDDYVYFISRIEGIEEISNLSGRQPLKNNNVMILGGSRIGVATASQLSSAYNVKMIENDPKKSFELTDKLPDVLVINADGRNVEILREENIDEMSIFIAVTGSSSANIMACLVATAHGVEKTIALVENIDYIQLSQMVGIDTMINKKLLAASKIFTNIRKGEVLSLTNLHGVDAEVLEFRVKPKSKVTRKPIRNLNLPKGAIIGGIIRNGEGMITQGDFQIEEDDHVVVFSMNDSIQKVEGFFN